VQPIEKNGTHLSHQNVERVFIESTYAALWDQVVGGISK
jgi:hypothetical protein